MSTPRNLIGLALKLSGAVGLGQSAPASDVADALLMLQQLGAQWQRKRWLVPHLADTAIPLASGQATLRLGLGGDVSIPRPDRIESAYLRLQPKSPQPVDWPVRVIDAREDWNAVSVKTVQGVPSAVFYDPAYPFGLLTLYPVPVRGNSYELHIATKDLPQFGSLDADLGLPAEYDAAISYNLAVRLRPYYQLPPDPAITALAMDSLNLIRNANAAIPHLKMPSNLPGLRASGDWWNGIAVGGGASAAPSNGFQVGISPLDGPMVTL